MSHGPAAIYVYLACGAILLGAGIHLLRDAARMLYSRGSDARARSGSRVAAAVVAVMSALVFVTNRDPVMLLLFVPTAIALVALWIPRRGFGFRT